MAWAGWKVHREYYYNDAGEQIMRLARSVWARYQEHLGEAVSFPEDGYHGGYVREIAARIAAEQGDRFRGDDGPEALDAMRLFAVRVLREEQNRDLADFGVRFDEFFLESSLYDSGRVEETIERLRATGLAYEKDGALWLRTTEFGDDKDRVMVKSTGHPTYFLPDVCLPRPQVGARLPPGDQRAGLRPPRHRGARARRAAGAGAPRRLPGVRAAPDGAGDARRPGGQVLQAGRRLRHPARPVRRGRRGRDALLLPDAPPGVAAHLRPGPGAGAVGPNPVYKVQYAHARMSSIFRRAGVEAGSIAADGAELALLAHPAEADLAKLLLRFPEVIEAAAEQHAPHAVTEYLEEVAGAVNSWYHAGNRDPQLRVVGVPEALSRARLVLARAIQTVLRNGLAVLGIDAPERMERAETEESQESTLVP